MIATWSASPRAEIQILLHQQDGQADRVAQIGDGAADILDDRRLDALGRLVKHEQFRARHQRAADRQLLLLAAGKIAAAPA